MSGWRGMHIAMGCMRIMRGRSSGWMAEFMCSPKRRRTGGWQDSGRWDAGQDVEVAPDVAGGTGTGGGKGSTDLLAEARCPSWNDAGALVLLRDEDISGKLEPCTQILNLFQGELPLSGQEH